MLLCHLHCVGEVGEVGACETLILHRVCAHAHVCDGLHLVGELVAWEG